MLSVSFLLDSPCSILSQARKVIGIPDCYLRMLLKGGILFCVLCIFHQPDGELFRKKMKMFILKKTA